MIFSLIRPDYATISGVIGKSSMLQDLLLFKMWKTNVFVCKIAEHGSRGIIEIVN